MLIIMGTLITMLIIMGILFSYIGYQTQNPLCMFTTDWLVSPPSLSFVVQSDKFYHEQISKAVKMNSIPD